MESGGRKRPPHASPRCRFHVWVPRRTIRAKRLRSVHALFAVLRFFHRGFSGFWLHLLPSASPIWAERSKEQLGARFKTKMVVGAMALSLLPVVFMFFVSYSLLNRTLGRWFPRPLEIASEQTQHLLTDFGKSQIPRLSALARRAQAIPSRPVDKFL